MILLYVISAFVNHSVRLLVFALWWNACQAKWHLFWVEKFAVFGNDSFEVVLGSDWERETIRVKFEEIFFDLRHKALEDGFFFLELFVLFRNGNKLLVFLSQCLIDLDLLDITVPNIWNHAKRFKVHDESVGSVKFLESVSELPEELLPNHIRFVCRLFQYQINEWVVISFKADQSLGQLVTVLDELVFEHFLQFANCKESDFLVSDFGIQ